jgi:hypothetical protein
MARGHFAILLFRKEQLYWRLPDNPMVAMSMVWIELCYSYAKYITYYVGDERVNKDEKNRQARS